MPSAPVLVLLPPSVGRTAGGAGPPLGRGLGLSLPSLAPARRALISALRTAGTSDPDGLVAGLGLPAGLAAAALAAGRTRHRDPMVAVASAAHALDLRVGDTSSRSGRLVDLIGRYTPGVVPSAR